MDQKMLKELARFKMMLKRVSDHSTDIEKLLSDETYARQVLTMAEESDNEELVLMSLEFKDKLGLLPQVGAMHEPEPDGKDDEDDGKYVYGPRG